MKTTRTSERLLAAGGVVAVCVVLYFVFDQKLHSEISPGDYYPAQATETAFAPAIEYVKPSPFPDIQPKNREARRRVTNSSDTSTRFASSIAPAQDAAAMPSVARDLASDQDSTHPSTLLVDQPKSQVTSEGNQPRDGAPPVPKLTAVETDRRDTESSQFLGVGIPIPALGKSLR